MSESDLQLSVNGQRVLAALLQMLKLDADDPNLEINVAGVLELRKLLERG